MRLNIISLLLAGLIAITGCQASKHPTTILPPVVHVDPTPEPEKPRTDLPINWFEVKGGDVSFGLPIEFDKLTIGLPSGTISRYYSVQKNLTIDLTTHEWNSDLHDFIMHNFLNNKNIVTMKIEEKNDGTKIIIGIHSLSRIPFDAFLDFFTKSGNVVYQVSCHSAADNLKKYASTCFEVIDTLVLK